MRRSLPLILALVTIAACTPSPANAPAASGDTKAHITGQTQAELQAVLQAQHDAVAGQDLTGYQKTFDSTRLAFRRCQQETFDIAGRRGAAPTTPRIAKIEPFLDQYVTAYADEGDNGFRRVWFRREEGRWIQTEPKESELGGEKTKTGDSVTLDYWGMDEDLSGAYLKASQQARDVVAKNALSEKSQQLSIRFYPTKEVAGPQGCTVVGFHLTNVPSDLFVRFFRWWFDGSLTQLSPLTVSFITHEGLHGAQDQFIPGISARLDWWLVEGWPDYVGQSRTLAAIKSALCGTPTPTFKQLVDGPAPDLPPEAAPQYYAFANTMVEYLYATFGNGAYRDLAIVYKDGVDPKVNYPKVLKVTPEQFYAGWMAAAKKKYC
ncbi:MAG: hypothetical protein M3O91_10540 [Chloroflexota bacterium]|nr:hypothetical protein [Chloroflexota bacterium]